MTCTKGYLKKAGRHTADSGSIIGGVRYTAFSGRFDIELDLIDAFLEILTYILTPKAEHGISHVDKRCINFFVPLDIPLDFGNPEIAVAFDDSFCFLPLMAVPELSIHEDGQPVFAYHDIGPARNVLGMGAITDALCPKGLAQ